MAWNITVQVLDSSTNNPINNLTQQDFSGPFLQNFQSKGSGLYTMSITPSHPKPPAEPSASLEVRAPGYLPKILTIDQPSPPTYPVSLAYASLPSTTISAIDGYNAPVFRSTTSNSITFTVTTSGGQPPYKYVYTLDGNSSGQTQSKQASFGPGLPLGPHNFSVQTIDANNIQTRTPVFSWVVELLSAYISFKVMSFNMNMAAALKDANGNTLTNEQRLQLIKDFLINIQPDIALFQEIDNGTDRSKLSDGTRVNQAQWIAENTVISPQDIPFFNNYLFAKYSDYQNGEIGTAILSRFPRSSTYVDGTLPSTYGTSIPEILITIPGTSISFRVIAAHFDYKDENMRLKTARYVATRMDQNWQTPVVFGGDLNLKPFSSGTDAQSINVLESRLMDSFYRAPPEYRVGDNNCSGGQGAPDLNHAVDYILLRGAFKVKSWCAPCSTNDLQAPVKGICSGPDRPSLTDHSIPRVELEYGGSWSGWSYEKAGSEPTLASGPGVSSWGLTGATWGSGRLDVFAKGPDGTIYHKWFDNGVWAGWESLGMPASGAVNSDPAAVSWSSGRIDVFVRGKDNALWHTWWDGQSWGNPPSSRWESLGGVLYSGPAVSSWGSGVLYVFVKAVAGDINYKSRDFLTGVWTDWKSLGMPASGPVSSDPAAVSWSSGRIDVFVRGKDNALWHKFFDSGVWINGWSDWESLGGVLYSGPAVSSWGSGRLDIFVKAVAGDIDHKWYDGQWNDWQSLGMPASGAVNSDPAAASWSSGRIDVFVNGKDNLLYHKWFS